MVVLDMYMIFGYMLYEVGHTHRYKFCLKKNQVKSPSHGLASRKPVRIRRSGRTENRGVTNAMSRTKISGNSLTVSTLVRRELLLRRIDLSKHRIIVVSLRD